MAADGIILSIEYNVERNELGYTSSDKLAYIRKFSPVGSEMTLTAVLQGHEAEVTQVGCCIANSDVVRNKTNYFDLDKVAQEGETMDNWI